MKSRGAQKGSKSLFLGVLGVKSHTVEMGRFWGFGQNYDRAHMDQISGFWPFWQNRGGGSSVAPEGPKTLKIAVFDDFDDVANYSVFMTRCKHACNAYKT